MQRVVPHYRLPFFEGVRAALRRHGVELRLLYTDGTAADQARHDQAAPAWGRRAGLRVVRVLGRELLWQPSLAASRDADLVIVEQASGQLVNYLLLLRQRLGGPRVAMWGHGRNFQTSEASWLGEAVKRLTSRAPWWWFAYNDLSAEVIVANGYPRQRVTVVQNAVDTRALARQREDCSPSQIAALRGSLGLEGAVGLFCGGMYPLKRLPFLLSAARAVHRAVPGFHLLLVGDGIDAPLARAAADEHDWVHYVGPKVGGAQIPFFALADVLLMPGLVGLAVLDSFALHVPLITSATGEHSPEIAYLQDGVNGVIVEDGGQPEAFASAVIDILRDRPLLDRLRQGCKEAECVYTLEQMIDNFCEGVTSAMGR